MKFLNIVLLFAAAVVTMSRRRRRRDPDVAEEGCGVAGADGQVIKCDTGKECCDVDKNPADGGNCVDVGQCPADDVLTEGNPGGRRRRRRY